MKIVIVNKYCTEESSFCVFIYAFSIHFQQFGFHQTLYVYSLHFIAFKFFVVNLDILFVYLD